MILGIGIDMIEVKRIAESINRLDFKQKVFSAHEINYCETKINKAESYAARFAAKEAFLKALGTGWRGGVAFNEVEIINDELGKPIINLIGETAKIYHSNNIKTIHVSLSHVKEMAIATVILEN